MMSVTAEWVSASGSLAGALVAAIGLAFTWYQLRELANETKNASDQAKALTEQAKSAVQQATSLAQQARTMALTAVLQVESQMQDRKARLDDASARLEEARAKGNVKTELVESLGVSVSTAFEDYVNAVDRLAYIILHAYVPELDWKREYSDYFCNIIEADPAKFDPNTTRYQNLVELHQRWRNSR